MTPESREGYLWPPRCRLAFYDVHGACLGATTDRDCDLADRLMSRLNDRTVYLGLRTNSARWLAWDKQTVSRIEARIRYDLEFDAYRVAIERASPVGRQPIPCSTEFRWRLQIS
jgi:hypothetical protein